MQGKKGFASLTKEQHAAIASKGGKAAHAVGTAHEFTAEEARAAGRLGGKKVSANSAHMAEIGRKGGKAGAAKKKALVAKPTMQLENTIVFGMPEVE